MTKYGQVSAFDEKTGIATIQYIRPDACDKCGGCGMGSKVNSIDLKAECNVGDWARVELPDGRFVQATALAYGMPLVGFLLGLILGYVLSSHSEGWAILSSFVGLGISLLILRMNERRISGKPEWTPRIMAVYATKPDMPDLECGGPSL